MTGPSGRAEFFRREAGDYLRELEPLLGEGAPPLESLVRLARSLRGAAMLAGPTTFARAASELEHLIKQLREGRVGWTELAPRLRSVVGTFRRLASSAPAWDETRDLEATSLATDLRRFAGGEAAMEPLAPGDAAARSYIARETAVVAGAVERAARAIAETGEIQQDRLGEVRRAMKSLRGVAALDDFAPLGDLLGAIDAAAADLARCATAPDGAATLLHDAAGALGSLARIVAQGGAIDPDLLPPEAARVADALFSVLAGPSAAVPVESLLADGGGAVAPFGGRREGPPPADPLELAGLGDSLRQTSASLRAARSGITRRLQAFALIGALRTAPGALGHRPAGSFTARLLTTLEADPDFHQGQRLIEVLERAGYLLSAGARGDLLALGQQLDALAEELLEPPAWPADTAPQPLVVPIEDLLAEEAPVPIEWLAPDQPESAGADRTGFERSLGTYSRLIRSGASVTPLEAFLGTSAPAPTGVAASDIVPVESLLFSDESDVVPIQALLLHDQPDVVPIEVLLYGGKRALARADEVRRELESALQVASTEFQRLEPLLRELLDLVPLAIANPD